MRNPGSILGAWFALSLVAGGAARAQGIAEEAERLVAAEEQCLAENESQDEEVRTRREARVPSRFIVIGALTAGFMMGGGANGAYVSDPDSIAGAGYNLAARADVGLLHPLWLAGRARYFPAGAHTTLHLDALAGMNFRTYGNRWIEAGFVASGPVVATWSSHCQLRRNDFQLLGGLKLITTGGDPEADPADDVMAVQLGIQKMLRIRDLINWSLAALYDPFDPSYGGQFSMGLTGMFGLPSWLWIETVGGFLLGETNTFWMTIDLGVALEL